MAQLMLTKAYKFLEISLHNLVKNYTFKSINEKET